MFIIIPSSLLASVLITSYYSIFFKKKLEYLIQAFSKNFWRDLCLISEAESFLPTKLVTTVPTVPNHSSGVHQAQANECKRLRNSTAFGSYHGARTSFLNKPYLLEREKALHIQDFVWKDEEGSKRKRKEESFKQNK